jgi:hypothetical protein
VEVIGDTFIVNHDEEAAVSIGQAERDTWDDINELYGVGARGTPVSNRSEEPLGHYEVYVDHERDGEDDRNGNPVPEFLTDEYLD